MKKAYFEAYCGEGSYDEEYLHYSRVWHCIDIVDRMGITVRSALVLGAATGRVLEDIDRAWGVRAWGCEVSRWAHERIPGRYRRRIARADMRRYVPRLVRARRAFDLTFCNALMYLEPDDVTPVLTACRRVTRYFHYWGSTLEEHAEGDRYRRILEPKAWWAERFRESGFEPTRSPYLWRAPGKPTQ